MMTAPKPPAAIASKPSPRANTALRVVIAFWGFVALLLFGAFFYAVFVWSPSTEDDGQPNREASTPAPFTPDGTRHTAPPPHPTAAPRIEMIELPVVKGGSAIWGSVGRDTRGRIWMGVSTHGHGSAALVRYTPQTGRAIVHGDVLGQLKQAGVYHDGQSQIKIHSRIVPGPDGRLYFTSMDEQGEDAASQTPPLWGSHLWRLAPNAQHWEHLAHTREALIAVSCASRYVYALGYFGHVLYQFDTRTDSLRSVRVGSVGGHISRNVLSDGRGHAYVPRLEPGAAGGSAVSLVEFDAQLNEVANTPINHYLGGKDPAASHGITGFVHMRDGSIVFVTHEGCLYRIAPPPGNGPTPAAVTELGFFHPDGSRYVASMFTYDGTRHVMGVSMTRKGQFEWLTFDLTTLSATAAPLALSYDDNRIIWKHLLYGSITRDNDGHAYVVGTDMKTGKPLCFKMIVER